MVDDNDGAGVAAAAAADTATAAAGEGAGAATKSSPDQQSGKLGNPGTPLHVAVSSVFVIIIVVEDDAAYRPGWVCRGILATVNRLLNVVTSFVVEIINDFSTCCANCCEISMASSSPLMSPLLAVVVVAACEAAVAEKTILFLALLREMVFACFRSLAKMIVVRLILATATK